MSIYEKNKTNIILDLNCFLKKITARNSAKLTKMRLKIWANWLFIKNPWTNAKKKHFKHLKTDYNQKLWLEKIENYKVYLLFFVTSYL